MKRIDEHLERGKNVRRFFRLLKKERKSFLLIMLMGVLNNASMTAIPFVMGLAIDDLIRLLKEVGVSGITTAEVIAVMQVPAAVMLGLVMVIGGTSYIAESVMARVSESVVLTVRKAVTEKFTKLPIGFFDTHQVGEIMSRTTSDARKISDFLVMNVNQLFSSVVSLLLGLAMMLYISGMLSLVVVSIMLLSVVTTRWISNKNKVYAEKSQAALGDLSNVVEELYTGNVIVKSFNMQEDVSVKMDQVNRAYEEVYFKSKFINFSIYPAIRVLNQLSFVCSAVVGSVLAIRGSLSIGTLQAYLQYVNQISEPVTTSSYVVNSIQNALSAVERVFMILDSPEEARESLHPQTISEPKGVISFKGVKFGYTPDTLLMKDVSFDVKANQMVAIVGPTGAGKTTLVNLLMRFYEVNGGAITFDGIPVTQLTRQHLRSLFGMVLQDSWIFDGTVRDNIAYGKRDATYQEVVKAAEAAQSDHFIRTLPEGYDTVITNAGNTISQGQQQLLTIARILLADPSVVILDEATSSVDTRTEVSVQKAMKQMMRGRTSFVIAHRLSTIVSADVILVMKDGDIIEVGNHQELLSKGGFYAQLYNSQF